MDWPLRWGQSPGVLPAWAADSPPRWPPAPQPGWSGTPPKPPAGPPGQSASA